MLDLTTPRRSPMVLQASFFAVLSPRNKSTYISRNDALHLGHQWKVKVYIDDGIHHESCDGMKCVIDLITVILQFLFERFFVEYSTPQIYSVFVLRGISCVRR